MYSIVSQSGNITTYVTEFLIDDTSELANLPKHPKVAYSSRAICLSNNSIYVLGNDNEWHLFAATGGGGGGSGTGGGDGAPCTISKIEHIDGEGTYVTFQWTSDEGAIRTEVMLIPDGVGISTVYIDNDTNHLMCLMTDGKIIDAGLLPTGGSAQLVFATLEDIDNLFKKV